MHPEDAKAIARINAHLRGAREFPPPEDRRPTPVPWLLAGVLIGLLIAGFVLGDPFGPAREIW